MQFIPNHEKGQLCSFLNDQDAYDVEQVKVVVILGTWSCWWVDNTLNYASAKIKDSRVSTGKHACLHGTLDNQRGIYFGCILMSIW